MLKFTCCGGLEALEEDFGIHFEWNLAQKRMKPDGILRKTVDGGREYHQNFNQRSNVVKVFAALPVPPLFRLRARSSAKDQDPQRPNFLVNTTLSGSLKVTYLGSTTPVGWRIFEN